MLEQENLIFHPITMDDRDWINEKLKEDNLGACEYTFANNFIWAGVYGVQVGKIHDCGVIRYREQMNYKYSFPFGNGDKKSVIELLKGICGAHGHRLGIYPVDENDRLKLIEWFPGEFEITPDRDRFDYVYSVEKLSSLRGKKLHGKRNHIARFMDDGDWSYEKMSEDNITECRKMAQEWISMRSDKWNDEMEQEIGVLDVAFAHFKELNLKGGVLYKNGKIVAFTIGEQLNSDTFVVHFEKAFPDLQGAYPMINQQFVLHEAQQFAYVNREEDTGDLGLRKAKLSYYPDVLFKKYDAVESHVVFASERDREDVAGIWHNCFEDDIPYIKLFMENRFRNDNMLVIHEDGHPVSMASFLPVQITINGEKKHARYVYAVATLPAYRKKGYAAEILRHAAKKYEAPLILQPSDKEMHRYYEQQGFEEAFCESPCWIFNRGCTKRANMSDSQCNCLKAAENTMNEPKLSGMLGQWMISCANEKEYKAVRDSFFEREGYVEWDEEALAYAIKENAFCNGQTLLLSKDTACGVIQKAVLMYRVEGNRLHVMETTLEEKAVQDILPELLEATGTLLAYAGNMGGMILLPDRLKSWNYRDGYLGLTLG
ncbi:MAG: GNAT family N-acetyltransferase [Lachnospiraceae bacterium]|nr:GNAT family N-acetyltransferase [Lachnospiraceae bacterium]